MTRRAVHMSELLIAAGTAIGHDVTFFRCRTTATAAPVSRRRGDRDDRCLPRRALRDLPDVAVSVVASDPVASESGDSATFVSPQRQHARAAPGRPVAGGRGRARRRLRTHALSCTIPVGSRALRCRCRHCRTIWWRVTNRDPAPRARERLSHRPCSQQRGGFADRRRWRERTAVVSLSRVILRQAKCGQSGAIRCVRTGRRRCR